VPLRRVHMVTLTPTSFLSPFHQSCQSSLSFIPPAVAADQAQALVNTVLLGEVPEERPPEPPSDDTRPPAVWCCCCESWRRHHATAVLKMGNTRQLDNWSGSYSMLGADFGNL